MKWKVTTITIVLVVLISMTTNGLFTEDVKADSTEEIFSNDEGDIIGEVGKVTVENTVDNGYYTVVDFEGEYLDPVVVAYIMTRNGDNSVEVRVRNVQSTSCEIFMHTPQGGTHEEEEIGYMVMEKGVHTINDDSGEGILVEAGSVVTDNTHYDGEEYSGVRVDFSPVFHEYTLLDDYPALLHSLNTYNNEDFMTTSVSELTKEYFKIQQEAAGSDSDDHIEEIGWIALEAIEGLYSNPTTINGMGVEVVGNRYKHHNFGVDNPAREHIVITLDTENAVVICKGASTMDGNGYWTRAADEYSSNKFSVYAESTEEEEGERVHGPEYLSYVAFYGSTVFRQIDSDGDGLADQLELRIQNEEMYHLYFNEGYDHEEDDDDDDDCGGGDDDDDDDGGGWGGGCPYVSPWNGREYVRDNNLLIASEYQRGIVEDHYVLEKDLISVDGQLRLKVEEFKNTRNHFDRIGLYAINHPEGYHMGTTPEGRMVFYDEPIPIKSAQDLPGGTVLLGSNHESTRVRDGSSISLDFEGMGMEEIRDKVLIIRGQGYESRDNLDNWINLPPSLKSGIDVGITAEDISIEWSMFEDAEVFPRNHASDIVLPLSYIVDEIYHHRRDGLDSFEMMIYNDGDIYLESISIANSLPRNRVLVREAELIQATLDGHHGRKNVTDALSEDGTQRVQQLPGEDILLTFEDPGEISDTSERSYMIYSKGYYQLYEEDRVAINNENRLNTDNNILSHGPYDVQEWRVDDVNIRGLVHEFELDVSLKTETSGSGEYEISLKTYCGSQQIDIELYDEVTISGNSYTTLTFTKEYDLDSSVNNYDDGLDWVLTVEGDDLGVYIEQVSIEFTESLDPHNADTDGDGLTDGEEVLEYGTCPFLRDTDGDGISDYLEVMEYGTDPTDPDTSGNGLSDYEEIYEYGTDPLRKDTSGNGLSDYEEIQHGTEPLKWDTSGDGISDYDAINGYETTYFSHDDGEIEEHTVSIDGADPHEPYKNVDGTWRDTTGDGIPDVLASDPGRVYNKTFDDLPWIESLRKFEEVFNVTVDDDNDDDQENQKNQTKRKYYDNAFNPHTRYGGVPIVEDLEIEGTYRSRSTGADVTIKVYDPTGIQSIMIKNYLDSELIHISPSDVNSEGIVEKTASLDTRWTYWVNGWDLDIEVVNGAGNVYEEKTIEVDGIFSSYVDVIDNIAGTIISFANWIWDQVTSALSDIAYAVSQLADALVDWVKAQISTIFNAVVDPIISGLTSWAEGIEYHMTQFFSELAKWDALDGDESVSATMNAGSAFMLSFMGQQDKAEQITDVLMYVMNFIEPFQKYVNPMGAMTVIAEALGTNFDSGVMDYITDIKNAGVNSLGQALGNMLDIIITPSFMGLTGFDKIGLVTEVPSISINGIKNFIQQAGLNNEIIDIVCTAFENVDWSGITEDTANSVMIAVSLYLLFESFKTTMVGLSPSIRSVVDTVNSATALIMSLASAAMNNYLIGGYLACVGVITAFFGQIFSALSGNIPTFLINLALMPANIAAYGVSIYHAS